MKSFVKQGINEARIQRTIDPKIWATMSSASSKNRANGAVDVKPMRRDDSEVLLQKYVAGLLTIKAECPATEADIDTIGSYKLIGHAALNAGVSLDRIQKLYVENGGTFDGEISNEPVNEPDNTKEYPSYDEVNTEEPEFDDTEDVISTEPTFDDAIAAKIQATNIPDDHNDDLNQVENDIIEKPKDYPSYDEVDIKEPAPANFPILLKILRPVKKALIEIKMIETTVPESSCERPLYLHISIIICPIEQIKPPTQNALKQFFKIGEFGDF